MSLLQIIYKISSFKPNYSFVYDFLKDGIDYDSDNFDEEFEEFIGNCKPKLDKILSFAKQSPVLLGGGSDGLAYDIGDGKVLKLFSKTTSFLESVKTMKDMFDNKNFPETNVMIYDIGELGEFNAHPVYYYIQEKVNTSSKEINKLASQISRLIVDEINDQEPKHRPSFIKNFIDNLPNEIKVLISKINEIANNLQIRLHQNWDKKFIREVIIKLLRFGEMSFDYNENNIGITDYGTIKIFDPVFPGDE